MPRTTGRMSARRRRPSGASGAENALELERSRDLELIVAAVLGRLVRTPALKRRGVAESIALHVVVLHFAHALDAQRLPRQILARAPAALPAGHSLHRAGIELGPFAPRVTLERVLAQR